MADAAPHAPSGAGDSLPVSAAFARDGCAIVREFATAAECDGMRARMAQLIERWDPSAAPAAAFRTDEKQTETQGKSDYFLDSGDKIHFFLEPHAVDEATSALKAGLDKHESLNKVGHGLHLADDVFRAYSASPKVAALARSLGWEAPVLPQSMYIFKQKDNGAEVTAHQDSTFLFTEPRQTCLGLWLALEDATVQNGCVWGRPGSHKEPIRRQFHRNAAHFEEKEADAPQMLFRELADCAGAEDTRHPFKFGCVPWEGAMPEGMSKFSGDDASAEGVAAAGFVPLECKKGDLVLIHGAVDHLSLSNKSGKSRHTFQLHMIEGPDTAGGIVWSKENWLQLPNADGSRRPFMTLS